MQMQFKHADSETDCTPKLSLVGNPSQLDSPAFARAGGGVREMGHRIRKSERQRERGRETDRQRDQARDRERQRHREKERDTQIDRDKDGETKRHKCTPAQASGQACREVLMCATSQLRTV